MAQAQDADGQTVEAPGSAQWRQEMNTIATQGAGVLVLTGAGIPVVGQQYTLDLGGVMSTVAAPPNGWSDVTKYRVILMGTSGIPLDSAQDGVTHLEVRQVLSPASPIIDLTLNGYTQGGGFVGDLGDLRSQTGPLRLNLMFPESIVSAVRLVQVVLQYGLTATPA